ncbi:hypothetical protein CYY_001182 [Polysphondylium violaceum]|uniref:Glycosyltransferase n=1 Tax=Polysphondylium violaceum TaxID=133409 RepID=A0A8J4Q073_9MYCE|nr:hypothetical protein CYY_001182 [Polysphondylium violaceum]
MLLPKGSMYKLVFGIIALALVIILLTPSPNKDTTSTDKQLQQQQSKQQKNDKNNNNTPIFTLPTNNLIYNHNFKDQKEAWRSSHFMSSFIINSNQHQQSYYSLQSFHQWDGIFQHIDLRNYSSNLLTQYHTLTFQVEYINLNHRGKMSLMFRGLFSDGTQLGFNNRIDVINECQVKYDPKETRHNESVALAKEFVASVEKSEMEQRKSIISITLHSNRPFEYIIPNIILYEKGSILISNVALYYDRTNVLDAKTSKFSEMINHVTGSMHNHKTMLVDKYIRDYDREIEPFFKRASKSAYSQSSDITIVSQLDISRLDRLTECSKNWDGLISVAIYIKEEADVDKLKQLLRMPQHKSLAENTDIHLVFKHFNDKPYPINYLRNVAIDYSRTDYVFVLDIDFVPSPNAHHIMREALQNNPALLNDPKSVIAVAPFEIDGYDLDNTYRLPDNKETMISLIAQDAARQIHVRFAPEAHEATDYKSWETATDIYKATYMNHWEPYTVFRKTALQFDPRFSGYGWDKVSHSYHLSLLGYNFYVFPEVFIVHLYHPSAPWSKRTDEDHLQIWFNWCESVINLAYNYLPSSFETLNFKSISLLNGDQHLGIVNQ